MITRENLEKIGFKNTSYVVFSNEGTSVMSFSKEISTNDIYTEEYIDIMFSSIEQTGFRLWIKKKHKDVSFSCPLKLVSTMKEIEETISLFNK